jgi:hypothetical protein
MHTLRVESLKVAVLAVAALAVIGVWEVSKGIVMLPKPAEAVPPPPPDIHPALDHFLCYTVQELNSEEKPQQVELKNQFGTTLVQLGGARLLCVPTIKYLCDDRECPDLEYSTPPGPDGLPPRR